MRSMQRNPLARVFLAAVGSGLLTLITWRVGSAAVLALLFLALTAGAFALLTLAPDAIALWRHHSWRWWWRTAPDEGPFWPGTRIPRRPRRRR